MFPELSICGYPPRDFLEFNDFIDQCYATMDRINQHTADVGVLVGSPARNPEREGKDLFNAAFLLYQGKIQAEVHKTLLPNYDVFDEYRYFEPAFSWGCVSFKGRKLAVTICEDIWNLGDNPLYPRRLALGLQNRALAMQARGREGDADLAVASFVDALAVLDQESSRGIEDLPYVRAVVSLNEAEQVNQHALAYLNRLSDHLFVAARWKAASEGGDVLWQPGATRDV